MIESYLKEQVIFLQMYKWLLLTCPTLSPTAISAIVESSVSPDRWETIIFHPSDCANLVASKASENVPIWFIFSERQLHALNFMAFCIRSGFVAVKSSPTIFYKENIIKATTYIDRSWDIILTYLNSRLPCKFRPGHPVILFKGILNANYGILNQQFIVELY